MTFGLPRFLITIDTEGDNIWSKPKEITTQNARYLPRFQDLCERYGFKPTYLTNFEMAIDPFFIEFGRNVINRGSAEIGMHLHAWNSPPIVPLTTDDFQYCPYLIEYPEQIMAEKITFMTGLLEDTFGVKMVSHRSGRWAFNEQYARILVNHGYTVDCSVTPGISWRKHTGTPCGAGGTDYRRYPSSHYFLDLEDISCAGDSSLLEVPMTIHSTPLRRYFQPVERRDIASRVLNRFLKSNWLRPNGNNFLRMKQIVKSAHNNSMPYIEFMLHSSELMAGGSPTFPDNKSIEMLYSDLESLFVLVCKNFTGSTLWEYRRQLDANSPACKTKD